MLHSSQSQHQQQRRGPGDHHQQQHHYRYIHHHQRQQQQRLHKAVTVDRATRIEVLQCLAECCALVLQHAPEPQQQARLLVACVCKGLGGSTSQAVAALQLLLMVLHNITVQHTSSMLLRVVRVAWLALPAFP